MKTSSTPILHDPDPISSDPNISPTKELLPQNNDSSISSDLSFLLNFLDNEKNRHTYKQARRPKGIRKVTIIPNVQAYKNEFLQYMQAYKDESSFLISEVSDLGDGRVRFDQINPDDLDSRTQTTDSMHKASYKKSMTMPLGTLIKDESIEKREKLKSKTWIIYSTKSMKPGEIVKPSGFAKFKKVESHETEVETLNFDEPHDVRIFSAADLSSMRNKRHKQELKDFLNFVEKKKYPSAPDVSEPKETNLFNKFKISELREYIKAKESS